ncbi:hypothetical protein Bca52824_084379 [Brassica carinata]|uniref:Uncharacterized protein n=1 Tax=Brassica carinata TaxID=52824 RepID=A0A8X7PP11_BRACI|nr:hypothetical protein Bca52824_084379 [Brassica carinata]
MGDSETLAALKRAYADTILNTTKEAAARVLSSEKKTRMYQQEIVTVRDEAVNTLLRLKKMYDSKLLAILSSVFVTLLSIMLPPATNGIPASKILEILTSFDLYGVDINLCN